MEVILIIVAFYVGLLVGFLIKLYLNKIYLKNIAGDMGTINVIETPEKIVYQLELKSDPQDLEDKKRVVFKVVRHPSMASHNNHGI